MFVKLFRSIYDGTLADNWKALVTFQQLLILSDDQGTVDMTLGAMARVTGIPQEILREGIALLESPDEESRTPDAEGRRIVRLDSHREWGWTIVNFRKYRELRSREDKREADRVRIATKREEARRTATNRDMSQDVASCRVVSQSVAEVAQAEAEEEREAKERATRTKRATPACGATIEQLVGLELPRGLRVDSWESWVRHRQAMPKAKRIATVEQAQAQLRQLEGWIAEGHDANRIIAASLAAGWQGLFPKPETLVQQQRSNLLAFRHEPISNARKPLT